MWYGTGHVVSSPLDVFFVNKNRKRRIELVQINDGLQCISWSFLFYVVLEENLWHAFSIEGGNSTLSLAESRKLPQLDM
jgi:hypothetical protein